MSQIVELIRVMGEAVTIEDLFFTMTQASRLAKHPPMEILFDGSYYAEGKLTSATTFEAVVEFCLEPAGADGSKVATFLCSVAIKYRILAERKALLTNAAIQAFAQINAVHQAYPYVREFVQSSCGRLGLPPIILTPLPARELFANFREAAGVATIETIVTAPNEKVAAIR